VGGAADDGGGLLGQGGRLRRAKSLQPASGAMPLNVRNARRNAGDGDDHLVRDEVCQCNNA
jgi:hypothetical protein